MEVPNWLHLPIIFVIVAPFFEKAKRILAWEHLSQLCDQTILATISQEISLAEAIPMAADLIAGKIRGRLIVDVNR